MPARRLDTVGELAGRQLLNEKPRLVNVLRRKGAVGMVIAKRFAAFV